MGRVGFDPRIFFPSDGRSPVTWITGGGSEYAALWRTRDEFCTVRNSAR
jgi:hypothetical protein